MPWPAQWTVACDVGMLIVTVGAHEPDGENMIMFNGTLADEDCLIAARNARLILRRILD